MWPKSSHSTVQQDSKAFGVALCWAGSQGAPVPQGCGPDTHHFGCRMAEAVLAAPLKP